MIKDKTKKYSIIKAHKNIRMGKLIKDDKAVIEYSAVLDLTGDIKIGEYSHISHEVKIFTHKHKWNHSRGLRKAIQKIEPVNLEIGKDVFIGVCSIIIGVSKIGDGAIIGAGSVITKDIQPYEVWAGNPAKKIKERIDEWTSE